MTTHSRLALAALLLLPIVARGDDFERDVRPILVARCFTCHGPQKQKSGLRLDLKSSALKGGDSGVAIVPGKSGDSPLLQRIASKDKDERMPPSGEPLSGEQIAVLKAWIDDGAKWPDAEFQRDPKLDHWAFRPVVRPAVPSIGVASPIDAFIRTRLAKGNLAPSPEVDRRTLIRRLKFDLLGLPPTPEEVQAFVADSDPLAYARVVDRYLASPRYGERWARHWLDVVRFAESDGFETNQPRANAWPYRDYVIRVLNDDLPYDRFVMEQLAGDQLGAAAATGFLVAGAVDRVKSPDVALTLQQRADELHDMVATTGSAFLGLTVGCARCHNHKFDPVSQVDYYALKAVFAGVQHGERPTAPALSPEQVARASALRRELAEVEQMLADAEPLAQPAGPAGRRAAVNARQNTEHFAAVGAKLVRFTVLATNLYEPCLDELEVYSVGPMSRNVALASAGAKVRSSGDYSASPDIHRLEFINDGRYGNRHSWISSEVGRGWVEVEFPAPVTIDRVVWGRDREGAYIDRLAVNYKIEVAATLGAWQVVASSDDRVAFGSPPPAAERGLRERQAALAKELAAAERLPQVYAGRFTAAEETHRLQRGDPMQKRERVNPAALAEFGPPLNLPADAPEAQRRLALAKWIVDPHNPLTARVLVNRLWQHHFGEGIVGTPSDFGRNGARPSHPELLDWLASEFVAGGWRIKPLHRLIVLSETYRQSSRADAAGMAADAGSRLLWRFPPRRLEAEPLRDAILAVSGKLDSRMGGPGFDLFEPNTNYVKVYNPKTDFGAAEWRRMIFQAKPRMQLDDTFGAFDCPDAGQIAPRRGSSTTALQALNLLNSRFLLQQAGFFAQRVEREAGPDSAAQVRRAFRLAFQREPATDELASALQLVREHGLPALCLALLNANEFLYVE